MKIVLIGFMGSGKSKVGRLLAAKLGWPHHDTDDMIAKQVGMPAGEIIRTKGEAAFRDVEKRAVSLIALSDRCVISTGGGVPLDSFAMSELARNATVVWLKISPETALQRAGNLKSRPLIDPAKPLESIRQRMNDRNPIYQRTAQHTVESDGLAPEDVVEKIAALLPTPLP
jgi:shikimate kinase